MAITKLNNLSVSAITALPSGLGGKVLQAVTTTKTDTFDAIAASPSFTDVTGLSVSITPSSASNKILVLASYNLSANSNDFTYSRLVRGSTAVFVGDASTNRVLASNMCQENSANTGVAGSINVMFLDSPSTTSSTTYKIQACTTGNTVYVNKSGRDAASTVSDGRFASSITVMEIAP
jgi:hypothetical protein